MITMTLTGDPSRADSGFNDPPNNPLVLLQQWLKQADELAVSEPRSMMIATVDHDHRPSSRVVLLKDCNEGGIIFSTSQESAKGKDLLLNPWAAGTLWWRETMQQINFQGKVTQLSNEHSDEVFQARPREAQAVAVLSRQSAPLNNEAALRDQIRELIQAGEKISRPARWHAYYLAIESIEFWHGSKDRFHQRLHYDLLDGAWHYQRLQP